MVDRLKNIITKARNDGRDVDLFVLWKDSTDDEKWSLVISAGWIDSDLRRKSLDYWLTLLQKNLDREDLNSIGRVSILKLNDNFVRTLTSLNVSGGPVYIKNNQIGDYNIHDAIIFEAKQLGAGHSLIKRKNPNTDPRINPKERINL